MLKFLGRGSAFNVKEGNTAAYFISNNELFLIDCGESVFSRILEKNILDGVEKVNILITHLHSDHVGSLGSLISYIYHVLNIEVNIITSDNVLYVDELKNFLKAVNCLDKCKFVSTDLYRNKYDMFGEINFFKTIHSESMDCYGILFSRGDKSTYYSGDTSDAELIKNIISTYSLEYLYVDVTSNISQSKSHMYIDNLNNIIPDDFKPKVWCMHISDDECLKIVSKLGYNIVECI